MKQTTTQLPAADIAVLRQCRAISEKIERLQVNLDLAKQLPCSEPGISDPLAIIPPHGVETHRNRLLLQEQQLKSLKAEFEPIRAEAQRIADGIKNPRLRRFCELYCIDGVGLSFMHELCGCCERTICRYISLIQNPTPD